MSNEQRLRNYLLEFGKNKTYKELREEFSIVSERRVRTIWENLVPSSEDIIDGLEGELVPGRIPIPAVPDGYEVFRGGVTTNGGMSFSFRKAEEKVNYEELFTSLASFGRVRAIEPYKEEDPIIHLVISDVHIGMCTRNSLFNKTWGITALNERLAHAAKSIPAGSKVVVNQLGDYADGERGRTASNTHSLEQNLSDADIFETGVTSFMYLIDMLNLHSDVVEINWLSNSNHPTVVDKNIGLALKVIFAQKYPGMKFNILDDSFNLINFNGVTFLITHGKDRQYMKQGLPKMLTGDILYKLKMFLNHNLVEEAVMLRGDLHQYIDTRHEYIRDVMCPSLAPPSGWVATNFLNPFNGGFLIIEQRGKQIDVKLRTF